MLYDHIVIGSGITALGILRALESKNIAPRDVRIICDDRNTRANYPGSKQLLQEFALGGNGKYWHGVVPLFDVPGSESEFFDFMESIFKVSLSTNESIFVPRRVQPLVTNQSFNIWLDSCVKGHAKSIDYDGENFSISLGDKVLRSRRLYIAAGTYGANTLLRNSFFRKFCLSDCSDHICGTLGLITRNGLHELLERNFRSDFNNAGYTIPVKNTEYGLLTFRPAYFEMRGLNSAHLLGPTYSHRKTEMLKKLLSKRSFGKIAEAAALKTGLFYRSQFYSVHFQRNCRSALNFDENNSISISETVINDVIELFANNQLDLSMKFEPNHYFGTHLHGSISNNINDIAPDRLIVFGPATSNGIGNLHHTFFEYYKAFKKVIQMEI